MANVEKKPVVQGFLFRMISHGYPHYVYKKPVMRMKSSVIRNIFICNLFSMMHPFHFKIVFEIIINW